MVSQIGGIFGVGCCGEWLWWDEVLFECLTVDKSLFDLVRHFLNYSTESKQVPFYP